jgi:ribulose-phosphate 3-epimerase
VDGGIKPGTARDVVRAGADVLVAGSAIFGADSYASAVRALREDAA